MVTVLTNEHYTTINNFSRKISKGVNSDDLSQHVILKLLQKDTQFINGLISRGNEFNLFIWRFISRMYTHRGSSFNRIETETFDIKQRKITVSLDFVDIADEQKEEDIDLMSIILKAELTDLERMYLNSYIDSGCSYKQCSRDLDIHQQTISKYVKQALKKCKNSL